MATVTTAAIFASVVITFPQFICIFIILIIAIAKAFVLSMGVVAAVECNNRTKKNKYVKLRLN